MTICCAAAAALCFSTLCLPPLPHPPRSPQHLAQLLYHKLTSPTDPAGLEWATLCAGVPGSYALLPRPTPAPPNPYPPLNSASSTVPAPHSCDPTHSALPDMDTPLQLAARTDPGGGRGATAGTLGWRWGSKSAGRSAPWGASVLPEARDPRPTAPQPHQPQQGVQGQAQGLQERRTYTIPTAFQSEISHVLMAQQQLQQQHSGAATPTLRGQESSGAAGSLMPSGGGRLGVGGGGSRRGMGAGSQRSVESPGPGLDPYVTRTAAAASGQRPTSGASFHPVDVDNLGLGLDLGLAAAVRTAPAGAATATSPASSGTLGLPPYGPPASVLTVQELDGSSSLRSHMGVLVGSVMSTLRQSAESCEAAAQSTQTLGG